MNIKNPIQPLKKDDNGTLRFKKNKIVEFLLNSGPFDMNVIARKNFTKDDRQQFAQLIGYSLGGYSELTNYVDNEAYYAAEKMFKKKMSEKDARLNFLEELVKNLKEELREPIAELFEIHPDDLN